MRASHSSDSYRPALHVAAFERFTRKPSLLLRPPTDLRGIPAACVSLTSHGAAGMGCLPRTAYDGPRGAARLPRGIIPVPLFTRMPDGVTPRRCVHTVSASRIFSSCRTGFVRTTLIIDHAGAPVKHRNPYFFSECGNTHRNGLDKKIGPCYTESNGSFKCFRCRPGSGRG